jgi:hypothetical protein
MEANQTEAFVKLSKAIAQRLQHGDMDMPILKSLSFTNLPATTRSRTEGKTYRPRTTFLMVRL